MKARTDFIKSAMMASLLALPAFAAEKEINPPKTDRQPTRNYGQPRSASVERLGKVTKASELIGMEVQNLQNEKLGKVDELAVDIQSGRIVQVIVSLGGLLGIGNKTVAVTPRAFTLDETHKVLRLEADKEKLKGAPTFEMSKWDESKWDEYGETRPASTALGRVEKASKLIGMTVKNRQDEKLGSVENLMADLAAGRIVQVIVSSGGFLGIGDALSAVPPTAFRYEKSQEILHLDTTKEALTQAPHFKSTEWPNFSDPVYVGDVYRAYRTEPYFSTNAAPDNTARNVRDRQSDRLTPFDQGSSQADVDTTRRIRKEILDQKNLSVNARNVKIITANGRVTLRGPVNSDEEKRLLAEIAERIAQRENVDNQMEVKRDQ